MSHRAVSVGTTSRASTASAETHLATATHRSAARFIEDGEWARVNRLATKIQRWWRRAKLRRMERELMLRSRNERMAREIYLELIDECLATEMIPLVIKEALVAPLEENSFEEKCAYWEYESLVRAEVPEMCREVAEEVIQAMVHQYLIVEEAKRGKRTILDKVMDRLIHEFMLDLLHDVAEDAVEDSVQAYFKEKRARDDFWNMVEREIWFTARVEFRTVLRARAKKRAEHLRTARNWFMGRVGGAHTEFEHKGHEELRVHSTVLSKLQVDEERLQRRKKLNAERLRNRRTRNAARTAMQEGVGAAWFRGVLTDLADAKKLLEAPVGPEPDAKAEPADSKQDKPLSIASADGGPLERRAGGVAHSSARASRGGSMAPDSKVKDAEGSVKTMDEAASKAKSARSDGSGGDAKISGAQTGDAKAGPGTGRAMVDDDAKTVGTVEPMAVRDLLTHDEMIEEAIRSKESVELQLDAMRKHIQRLEAKLMSIKAQNTATKARGADADDTASEASEARVLGGRTPR